MDLAVRPSYPIKRCAPFKPSERAIETSGADGLNGLNCLNGWNKRAEPAMDLTVTPAIK
jgi:hypothetical protein